MSRPGYGVEVLGAIEEREPLYQDKRREIVVTPSWLNVERTRYAIRTVVRLDSQESKPSVEMAYVFFFGGLALMAYSLLQFAKPTLPDFIPWVMLVASLGVSLGSAWLAFTAKVRYRLLVTLLDGSRVPIDVPTKKAATELLEAITLAMDWHRSADIVIDAQRTSHVRRRLATASGLSAGARASNDEQSADTEQAQSDKQRRHVQRLMPFLAAMFKDRS